jgi:hypothetical protein
MVFCTSGVTPTGLFRYQGERALMLDDDELIAGKATGKRLPISTSGTYR